MVYKQQKSSRNYSWLYDDTFSNVTVLNRVDKPNVFPQIMIYLYYAV